MFDLLPIQTAVNSLHSTILTNQHTFGVQNVVVERDCGLTMNEISGGLNLLEINPGSRPPAGLNLTSTPAEIFNYLTTLEREMEMISGINSVARGNPDPKQNLRSGNALALIQSQALQFISGLQQSYIQLIEDVGTNLVKLLQDFAAVPRIAFISGKANATEMKEFKGEDLNSITRVIVDAGNALANTTAGKLEIAGQLLQMGLIKTPEEYLSVLATGKLETMTESQNKQLWLIRSENEALVENKPVIAILTDDHNLHIREHQAVLADSSLRMDPDLLRRTTEHLQAHIDILSNPANAQILIQLGQQPIQPVAPVPGQPTGAPAANPAAGDTGEGVTPGLMENAPAQDLSVASNMPKQPQPASPPAPFEEAPTDGAQLFAQNAGG